MPFARAALSVLFASALLPACGPDKVDDSDDGADESADDGADESAEDGAGDSSGGAEDGGSSGGETDGPATTSPQEPDDASREGQACGTDGTSADCRVDGVAGLEFCTYSWDTGETRWSACLTETCAKYGDSRACEGGNQYCTDHWTGSESKLLWGVCTSAGECKLGETADCGFGEEMQISMGCSLDANGVPKWNVEDCNTPLVLSFGDALEFTPAPVRAADFDIHGGAGVCTRADWPSAATPWLALDRDHSGSIDGGHELFGSGTRLSAGTGAPNGFAALAELDSDADGKLTAADARWSELVLWADHDADRRSTAWETLPLASFEIVEIELAYDNRRECDAAGNCARERARFVYRTATGGERSGEVIDVHLACE